MLGMRYNCMLGMRHTIFTPEQRALVDEKIFIYGTPGGRRFSRLRGAPVDEEILFYEGPILHTI